MIALETKIRALAAALDDSALEALASKGLLRRAQKDIERGIKIHVDREDNGILYLKVDNFDVAFPEAGPAKATCSCPAAGVCQHILAAVLYLRLADPPSESAETPQKADASEQEILSLTREQLEAWAGKASFRAGLELAARTDAQIIAERGVLIQFPTINARCHYVPGGGLDGIIVLGNSKDERRLAIAAVIAFQKSKGVDWQLPTGTTTPEESAGAPRSRSEVLEVTQEILSEILNNGLARVSTATQQRLATLAVSATGVNLPRLALELRGLSDECSLVTARAAQSDLGRMLGRMAHAHALCSALQSNVAQARPDLVGWHRTVYDEIGHIDLIGVAAWPWRTASGYTGLTVLFWDGTAKRWNSWTESRPAQQRDFDPVSRYTQPGPWEGAESPRQLSRSSFRLMNARRNPLNRLSASTKSRALVTGPTNLHTQAVPMIEDWTQLVQSLQSQATVGLKETNPLESIFVLKPAAWAQRNYDPVNQLFTWWLLDSQKHPLRLEITFDRFSEPAIQFLEKAAESSLQGVAIVGRVQRASSRLTLHPHSLHLADGQITHLYLDTTKPAEPKKQTATVSEDDDGIDFEEENEPVMGCSPGVSRVLDEADESLLRIAETGIAGFNLSRIAKMETLLPRVERLHLEALSRGLKNVIARPQATTVLRCCYLNQLHRLSAPLTQ